MVALKVGKIAWWVFPPSSLIHLNTHTHKKHNVSLWNCVKVWKQWPATTWLLPSAQFLVTQWNSLTCSVPRLLSSVSLATALKAFSTPNVICPSACYGTAAVVVYTGLRKEPCEPGGNCVKSPCELLVRWLADRWVCKPGAGKGREGGRRIREKGRGERRRERRKDSVLKASMQGAGWLSLHVRGSLSSCGEEHCLQRKGRGWWWWRRGLGVVFRGNRAFPTWSDIHKQRPVCELSVALIVNIQWLTVIIWYDMMYLMVFPIPEGLVCEMWYIIGYFISLWQFMTIERWRSLTRLHAVSISVTTSPIFPSLISKSIVKQVTWRYDSAGLGHFFPCLILIRLKTEKTAQKYPGQSCCSSNCHFSFFLSFFFLLFSKLFIGSNFCCPNKVRVLCLCLQKSAK